MRINRPIALLFLILLLLSSAWMQAQNWADSVYVAYYNNQPGHALDMGRKAISSHQATSDTYYKMGVIHYNLQHYGQAALLLQRAYAEYQHDPLYLEYLYYAYAMSGFADQARAIVGTSDSPLARRIGYKNHYLSNVQWEAGMLLPSNQVKARSEQNAPSQSRLFQATYFDQVQYSQLQLQSQPWPAVLISANVQLVVNRDTERVSYLRSPANNTLWTSQTFSDALPYMQAQCSAAYQWRTWTYKATGSWFGSQYIMRTPVATITAPSNVNVRVNEEKVIQQQQAATLAVQKRQGRFLAAWSGSYANFDTQPNWMSETGLFYFPWADNRLYVGVQWGYTTVPSEKRSSVHGQSGVRLHPKLWLEAYGGGGQLKNYIGGQGSVVLNTPQPIQWYGGLQMHYQHHRWLFTLGGGLQQREGIEYFSRPIPGSFPLRLSSEQQTYTYQYSLIKTKITWTW